MTPNDIDFVLIGLLAGWTLGMAFTCFVCKVGIFKPRTPPVSEGQ